MSPSAAANPQRRAFWLKQLHQWHWISSALSLVCMLLFAATGITLNHATQIDTEPKIVTRDAQLPAELVTLIAAQPQGERKAPLPQALAQWADKTLSVSSASRVAEWSDDEIYLALPRPGGDAWFSIDRESGELSYELTDRGWVSYFNDLHKGRNTGGLWNWFIDIFAVACLLFAFTGLFLLQLHARQRPSTWPMVGLGVVLPLVLMLLFVH